VHFREKTTLGNGQRFSPSPWMGEGWGGGGEALADNLVHLAKSLRRRPTEAEKLLWRHLRRKQLAGHKFRRQEPLGIYIVDFVCFEKGLIIEVAGGHHALEQVRDQEREAWLNKQGFKLLRFWNHEVLRNIDSVVATIRRACLPGKESEDF
jgi:very-short-patch-repair endonuclease